MSGILVGALTTEAIMATVACVFRVGGVAGIVLQLSFLTLFFSILIPFVLKV